MFKTTETYTDYNGIERTEDFYFNLTEAEITEMNYSESGAMKERMEAIVAAKNERELAAIFKKILLAAYGVKSDDGRLFRKSDRIREDFECSPVYNILYMRFATDDQAASAFINGIMPKIKQ